MNARTMLVVALGSVAILTCPSSLFAQAPADDPAPTVQAQSGHEHNHDEAAGAATATKSCCANMAHRTSQPASASAPAQAEPPAPSQDAKKADAGCCGGMMKSGMMKMEHQPPADQSAKGDAHECCCAGKM